MGNSHLQISSKTRSLYLWTREGLSKFVKSIDTPKAWEAYGYLTAVYFRFQDKDIKLADEIVQGNNNQKELEWLSKRTQSKVNRSVLTATMKNHGAVECYRDVTEINNKCIIGKSAKEIKKQREVKTTRDSFTVQELTLMSALEMPEAGRIEKENAIGDRSVKNAARNAAVDFWKVLKANNLAPKY